MFPAFSNLCAGALVTLLALSSTPAMADALADAKGGLEASGARNYSKAIALFTNAISSGQLENKDLELALVKRGEAFSETKHRAAALQDLQKALSLDATDSEALDAIMNIDPGGCEAPKPAPDVSLDIATTMFAKFQKCVAEAGGDLAAQGKLDKASQELILAKVEAAGRRIRLASSP
jgi:hypothetical protein